VNVSWSDLNNVLDAGEYPFRDGTIIVTFAEIAIWKTRPDAQFQLMRRHPIQDRTTYVLGAQFGQDPIMTDGLLLYESNNGDCWFLNRDPMSSAPIVMHKPNRQSGGQASYIEIDKFLQEGANGPEHQALKRFMETLVGSKAAS
jgi:hypothetical protein